MCSINGFSSSFKILGREIYFFFFLIFFSFVVATKQHQRLAEMMNATFYNSIHSAYIELIIDRDCELPFGGLRNTFLFVLLFYLF